MCIKIRIKVCHFKDESIFNLIYVILYFIKVWMVLQITISHSKRWRVLKFYFLLAGHKVDFISPCGTNKSIFLLAGHKVDFIAPCGANKSTFWPASRKKIVCNTGKTFIFPSCTMYYFWPPSRKKSCATQEKHLFYSCDSYPRFARTSNFALAK